MIAPDPQAPVIAPVFISFASAELKLAERIVTELERAGIRCWIANRDIEPGVSYPAAITAAVTGGSAMLLLLTEASNASPHVLSEVELAFNARKPILPVRLTPVALSPDLQYFLGTTQWLDAGTDFDDGDAARVLARLKRVTAAKPAGGLRRLAPTSTKRWIAYTAVVVVLLATVGTAIFRGWRSARVDGPHGQPAAPVSVPQPNPQTPAAGRDTPGATPPAAPDAVPKPATDAASSHLRVRVNARNGQAYVWIPPGRFTLGCSPGDSSCEKDESPSHIVRVRTGFWMGRTEVTKEQYAKARGGKGTVAQGELPATDVSWADAKAYCAAVGGRLPTEAEWEYAARAGTTSSRYDALGDIGWYQDNSDERPHPVGQKTANAFGLFDMLGNVYEWVADRYYDTYDETDTEPLVEPLAGNASGTVRGGAFASPAKDLRASNRFGLPPDAEEAIVGFRCVSDR